MMESTTRTPLHGRDIAVQQALREMTSEQRRQIDAHAAIKGLTREQLVVQIVCQTVKAEGH
ncbi:hypothetical protein [Pseudomonas anguilliseptica]|uniref:hypothetical protein n=1 Tax=Pseudomonas anguilliseptica TaxID=53406 RepID=UPI0022AEE040|nr:hypothetical protein [Pseudomonas anguilliseptica]MCZ4321427.1 hypothetical protein [Pseudomonas anguilliseptica]